MSDYTACVACGEEASGKHSLPVDNSATIVGVDYGGEWSAAPACEGCFCLHLATTKTMDRGAEDLGYKFADVHTAHMDATRELRRKLAKARADLQLMGRLAGETLDDIGHEPTDDGTIEPPPIALTLLLPASAFRPRTRVEVDGVVYRRDMDEWRKE